MKRTHGDIAIDKLPECGKHVMIFNGSWITDGHRRADGKWFEDDEERWEVNAEQWAPIPKDEESKK